MSGWLLLGAPAVSGFNGGRSQTNFSFLQTGGDYPFLNALKTAQSWAFVTAPTPNSPVTPDTLDADGYPTSLPHGTVYTVFSVPSQAARSGNYVITWTGNGTVYCGMSNTAQGGTSKTGSGGSGRYVFSTTSGDFIVGISALPVTNLQVFHVDDEAALTVRNEVFGVKFKQRLVEANFGVHRFLNWQSGNTTNVTTWDTRKPAGYVFYNASQLKSSLYCGTTSASVSSAGVAYTASRPANHSSDGTAWTSGAPQDKDTVHVLIGQSSFATFTSAASDGAGNTIITYSTGTYDTTFVNGETVQIYNITNGTGSGWTALNGSFTVSSVSGNTFKIPVNSASFTGTAGVDPTPVPGNIAHTAVTLNLGASGALTILDAYSNPITTRTDNNCLGGGWQSLATLVYDATLNKWIKQGGCFETGSVGIDSGAPPELMLQLCAEVRAHPYFISPPLAVDPATNYMPSLAQYCRDNGPSWMIPRFEGPNEIWNTTGGYYQTTYANAKATAYSVADPTHWSANDYHNWYGKVMSVLGQAVSTVYGGDRTKYQVLCGVQTVTSEDPVYGAIASDPRLTSASYVAQAAAPQSGYVKAAAKNYVTHICNAQYVNPSDYGTAAEATKAAEFALGDLTAPSRYIATMGGASAGVNLAYVAMLNAHWKVWAQSHGIQKMCGYEGGYSPNYTSYGATSDADRLRAAGKLVSALEGYTTLNYTNFTGLTDGTFTAEFPSNFLLASNLNTPIAWAILEDIYQTPTPPQWNAFVAFNH